MKLTVYDANGNVKKTAAAEMIDLEFGTVRKLMELLDIEKIDDTWALLQVVNSAWKEITTVLSRCFRDMDPDDWDHVKVKDLIPVVIEIMRYAMGEILGLPGDTKN